jgi:hypothetical protein
MPPLHGTKHVHVLCNLYNVTVNALLVVFLIRYLFFFGKIRYLISNVVLLTYL